MNGPLSVLTVCVRTHRVRHSLWSCAGLDKLENWQATVWNAWQSIKQAAGAEKDKVLCLLDSALSHHIHSFYTETVGDDKCRWFTVLLQAAAMRDMVKERLQEYKKGITKVGAILTDPKRTSFVVVCIAEFLSISESQRLLRELVKFNVAVCMRCVVSSWSEFLCVIRVFLRVLAGAEDDVSGCTGVACDRQPVDARLCSTRAVGGSSCAAIWRTEWHQ